MKLITDPKATATPETPWIGLRSFTEGDSHYFFGRNREIQELTNRIQHRQLTVLFGQSGLGKTSLIQAGVAPQLRAAGHQLVLVRLIHDPAILELELEQQVLKEMASRFTLADSLPATEAQSMWELFHDVRFGFVGRQTNQSRPMLVLDQFEEIFTLGLTKRSADASRFLESLACLVENRPPQDVLQRLETSDDYATQLKQSALPCRVLLSMRSDFLHHLERYRQRMPSMMDNRMELRRLSGMQAFEAVFCPGQKRVTEQEAATPILNRETAESIVRLVAGKSADVPLSEIENVPPLLSLICEQLNIHRCRRGKMTIDNADVQGSADEVLRDFVSRCFQAYPPAIRQFVEERLISSGGFRESVNLETAVSELSNASVANADQILRSLVNERLLTIEDRGGIPRIELTHDILAPVIVRLRSAGAPAQALQQAYLIYDSLGDESSRARLQKVAQRLFRSLSEITTSGQINSRAITVHKAAQEIGASGADVLQVARDFVAGGVLLVMDKTEVLTATTPLQVVHKSLFKQWNLLRTWIDEEERAAADYRRLVGLVLSKVKRLDDVSLDDFIQWRQKTSPTEEWAHRYNQVVTASSMLQRCLELIESSDSARRAATRRKFQRLYLIIGAFVLLLVVTSIQWRRAIVSENMAMKEAEQNAVSSTVDRVARSLSVYGQTYNAQQASQLVKDTNPDRLGWEWNYLQSRFGPLYREVGEPIKYGGDLLAIAVNSSGTLVATAHRDSMHGKLKGMTSRSQSAGSIVELLSFGSGTLKPLYQLEFNSTISALAFSRSNTLAVGDDSGRIEIRSLELAPVDTEIPRFESTIRQLAFCMNDSMLAVLVASNGKKIESKVASNAFSKSESSLQPSMSSLQLFDLQSKTKSLLLALSENLTSFVVSPDQHWAAVASDNDALLFDMRSPNPFSEVIPSSSGAKALAFHPTGEWLGVALGDGSISLYPISSSAKERALRSPPRIPCYHPQEQHADNHQIAFDLRGEMLLSTGGRGVHDFIDVSSLATLDLNAGTPGYLDLIGMSPSWGNFHVAAYALGGPQPYLLTQDSDDALRIWNWAPMIADASTIVCPETASQLAVSPHGRKIAVASDEDVRLFDSLTGMRIERFNLPEPLRSPETGTVENVHGPLETNENGDSLVTASKLLRFSSTEQTLILADTLRQCIWMIDVASGIDVTNSDEKELGSAPYIALDRTPTCLGVSSAPGAGLFAVGLSSGKVLLYRNRDQIQTYTLAGESPIPLSVEFSRDGKLLLIGGQCSNDETNVGFLHIVDLENPEQLPTAAQTAPQRPVHHLLYHVTQRSFYMAEVGQGTTKVSLWDIDADLQITESNSFTQLSLSNQCVGLCMLCPPHPNTSKPIAAHRVRILGSDDKTLKLWHAENSRELFSTAMYTLPITVGASDDGRVAASLDTTSMLHVWEAPGSPSPDLLQAAYKKVHGELDEQPLLKDVVAKVRSDRSLSDEARDWQLRLLRNRRGLGNHLADVKSDELSLLYDQVLQFVSRPELPENAYEPALARAKQLFQLEPDSSKYRLALGVAEYRGKRFENALKTLEPIAASSDALNSKIAATYLAMVRIALRQTDIENTALQLLAEESRPSAPPNSKAAPQANMRANQWYLDAKSELRSLLVPEMSFVDVQFTRTGTTWTVNATLQLKAAQPEFLPLLEFSLWLNGSQVATQPAISDDNLRLTWSSVAEPDTKLLTLEARVSFRKQPQSSLATTQVTRQVQSAERGRLHLLLCGSNKITKLAGLNTPGLKFPEKDVRDLHKCLLRKAAGLYDIGEVVILTGPQFSKTQFMEELRRLSSSLKGSSANDLFVLFQSGYGTNDDDAFAVHAYDTSIPWTDVASLLNLPCAVLALLDSSYSGNAVDFEASFNLTRPTERLHIMSACRGDQLCGDGVENGIFSGLIIKGLYGAADASSDHVVTLQELFDYVRAESPDSQQPQLFAGSQKLLALTLIDQNTMFEKTRATETK